MSVIAMKELLEAGVHFGHRTRRWNPKMRPFIFTERSGIHIIDLQQTMQRINEYAEMVRNVSAKGGTILFVGTKRQAQATVKQEADRCNMPYINQRWLGGTLTNWITIKQRIDYLLQMERRVDAGEFRTLSKKEQLGIQREIEKLNRRIGGLKTMRRLPDLIFIVDSHFRHRIKEVRAGDVAFFQQQVKIWPWFAIGKHCFFLHVTDIGIGQVKSVQYDCRVFQVGFGEGGFCCPDVGLDGCFRIFIDKKKIYLFELQHGEVEL